MNFYSAPCTATIGSVRTMDNVTYPYTAGSCWTLTSSHCGPNPVYAVFSKKVGNKLAIKAYFGGHSVEIAPSGQVKINGKFKMFFKTRFLKLVNFFKLLRSLQLLIFQFSIHF